MSATADKADMEQPDAVHTESKGDGDIKDVSKRAAIEKRLLRKLDTNLMPLVFVCYLMSFLDRSNIGNAKIAGMDDDLDLSSNAYQWLLTIFYIAYIVFEPCIIFWKLFPAHRVAALVAVTWGLIATMQAVAQSWQGEMALRFLLGASEAAFGPGIPYLLSFFYLRRELGSRCGIFLSAAPLASTFAGALAYGITSGHASIANWRLLFLVEGLPTICLGPIAWFFLPDSPAKARFLDAEEKEVGAERGVRQAGAADRIGGVNFGDILETIKDPKPWFTALMYFSCNVSFASLPVYLPQILKDMGFTSINAQGLSAPPYFVSFLITIGSTVVADKLQQRGIVIMVLSLVGCLGYIILAATENTGARYFATFLAAGGVFPSIANILPWVMNNQGTDTRRGVGMIMLNLIGQCGPILGTHLYPDSQAPRYTEGHATCAAFMLFTTFLALCLRTHLVWENKKLDKQHGTLTEIEARQAEDSTEEKEQVAVENYGPMYRFVL